MFGRKLGLTCATWSCVGASGAEVGPKRGPTWGIWPVFSMLHWSPGHAQQGATWDPLAPSFARNAAQQRHDMGNIAHNDASSMQKTWGTPMKIGCFEDFGLGWPCPLLFKPCGPSCGPEPVHLDDAGPIYKCANFQSRALSGGVDPEIAPPAEAVPGWQIGPFVSSAPKLSRRCGRISFSTCLKLGWWHRMRVKSLGTPATGMVSNFLRTLGGLIEPWLNSVLQMGFD